MRPPFRFVEFRSRKALHEVQSMHRPCRHNRVACDAGRKGILSLIQDLRYLGITVVQVLARRPAPKAAMQISLSLAA